MSEQQVVPMIHVTQPLLADVRAGCRGEMKGQLALSIAGIFCDLTASGSRTPFKVQHSGVDPVPNRKLSDSYFEQESP